MPLNIGRNVGDTAGSADAIGRLSAFPRPLADGAGAVDTLLAGKHVAAMNDTAFAFDVLLQIYEANWVIGPLVPKWEIGPVVPIFPVTS